MMFETLKRQVAFLSLILNVELFSLIFFTEHHKINNSCAALIAGLIANRTLSKKLNKFVKIYITNVSDNSLSHIKHTLSV